MRRERTTSSRREFDRTVADLMDRGWRLERLAPYHADLRRRTPWWKHAVAFALVGWWNFGAGSVLYGLWTRWRADKVRLRLVLADGGWRSDGAFVAPWFRSGDVRVHQ